MRALKRLGAIVWAMILAAATAGLVAADVYWPPAGAQPGSPAVIEVPPGDRTVVCPGSLKLPGDGEGAVVYDPLFDPNPTAVESISRGLVAGGDGGQAQALGETAAPTRLSGQGRAVSVVNGLVGDAPTSLTAFVGAAGAAPPVAAGATFQHLGDGDLRGVAATACAAGGADAWVVAGSTETGSSARLLLTNAGLTNVRADLSLWDGAGPVEAVGLTGLMVPPRSQRAILLEGYVGGASRLAVRVTASGGDLAVFLQHSRLQGLVQGGVELAAPGQGPALEALVGGLDVTASDFDSARTSALRVLNPGDQVASVSVELWGPDGPTSLPGLEEAQVNPGVVADLSLGGLPEGRYAALIRSDQPIVAAGLSLRSGGEGEVEEFAWTATAAAAAAGYVALPTADLTPLLVTSAAADTALVLTPIDQAGRLGQAKTIAVAAQTSQALDLAAMGADGDAAAVQFRWAGPAGALALIVSAEDEAGQMISAFTPPAVSVATTEVAIHPSRP
ncbi:MAG: DUF5719 family protein [Bifidobacteriaceae bacterium]|jgi:hypothetical protein|nr:DUF5719 family protein [Bifidobacteriaceae bacterium]